MNIMFFGGGQFPLNAFKVIHKINLKNRQFINDLALTTTISKEKYKKIENNYIMNYAKEQNINISQPITDEQKKKDCWLQFIESDYLKQKTYDLGIVCNFPYMIPSKVIDYFKNGMIVIHPSLLPKYRGAAPIQRALMEGETQTGVTFVEISKNKFDAGKILYQDKIEISNDIRYNQLQDQLSELSANKIEYILENLNYLKQNGRDQDQNIVTSANKIIPSEININFKQKTATQIYNLYRGIFGTTFQTIRTSYHMKSILLEQISLPSEEFNQALPSSIWCLNIKSSKLRKNLYVKCSDAWVRIDKFRYADRPLIQEPYTFIDQHIDKQKQFSLENSSGIYFFD